jgi:hypothetical protein
VVLHKISDSRNYTVSPELCTALTGGHLTQIATNAVRNFKMFVQQAKDDGALSAEQIVSMSSSLPYNKGLGDFCFFELGAGVGRFFAGQRRNGVTFKVSG